MPEKKYFYVFTITFRSMLCAKKFKLIENLHRVIANEWLYSKRRPFLELSYAVEYHNRAKYKNIKNVTDIHQYRSTVNVTAPHLHGYLKSSGYIAEHRIDNIRRMLEDRYGRTQFFIQEDSEEQVDWHNYCTKYVEWNDQLFQPYQHFKVVDIQFDDYQDPEPEEYDDNEY